MGRAPIPQATVGFMIRSTLARGPATVDEIKESMRDIMELLGFRFKPPKSRTIAWYISLLKGLGLVERVGTRPSNRGMDYAVYALTRLGRELPATDPRWMNPQAEYYRARGLTWTDPETGTTYPKNVLGRRRYRRRVLGIPPRPPGRPRKQYF